jgi:hypothetical protein
MEHAVNRKWHNNHAVQATAAALGLSIVLVPYFSLSVHQAAAPDLERYTKSMFSPRRARRTRRCRQDPARIPLLSFHFPLLSSFFMPFVLRGGYSGRDMDFESYNPVEATAPRRCSFVRPMFHYTIVPVGAALLGAVPHLYR